MIKGNEMPDSHEKYTIKLDKDWSLEDLYIFSRAFEQVYFSVYSISEGLDEYQTERVMHAYRIFPWQGGYSAVNFFNQLKYTIPKQQRPQIISIRYESPGWMDLALVTSVAISVGTIVKSIAVSIREINSTYNQIMQGMQQRKLLRIKTKEAELELFATHAKYIEQCAKAMANALGYSSLEELNKRTGHPY